MRKISFVLAASLALAAGAQNKIDFNGRLAIDAAKRVELGQDSSTGYIKVLGQEATPSQIYNTIVEFVDDNIDFGDLDVEIVTSFGSFAVVAVTPAQMESIAELPQVKAVSLGFEKNTEMYKARPAANVDVVQAGGDGLPSKFTGKGVMTGLMDSGLDVNHINFLDADGNPRTKGVWVCSTGRPTAYTTPEQIKGFTTENRNESHGTHVLGIMAGGYSGPGDYAVIDKRVTVTAQDAADSSIPFYGVATESSIGVGCGSLTDGNIVTAVSNIISLAEENNMPCVVNLSLGTNLGPHDGSTSICRSLAELGKRAIICVAAGNEGDQKISISSKIAGSDPLKTFISTSARATGTVQFWGSDANPFKFRFIGYDRSTAREVFSYSIDTNLKGSTVTQAAMEGFKNAFNGTVTASSNVDASNNRYCVALSLNLSALSSTSNILPGFVIETAEGQYVEGFSSTQEFVSNSIGGFYDGSTNNTISDMACAENVISVGSYVTNASFAVFGANGRGTSYTYDPRPVLDQLSSFSSYGHSFQGENLPTVCAPGEIIISSYNKYYMDAGHITQANLAGLYTGSKQSAFDVSARNSPWAQMQGTSMATPFVSGVVASWLEANPDLTFADVKRIIQESSTTDLVINREKERWGAGKINALEGIKLALGSAGMGSISTDSGTDVLFTQVADRTFEVSVPAARHINASLFNLAGHCVANVSAENESVTLDADNALPGIYVLRVEADKTVDSRKVTLK